MSEPRHLETMRQIDSHTPPRPISIQRDLDFKESPAKPGSASQQAPRIALQPMEAHFLAEQASKPDTASQLAALYRAAQKLDRQRHGLNSCEDEVKSLRAREGNSWARHRRYHDVYLESRRLYEPAISYTPSHLLLSEQQVRLRRRRLDDDSLRLESQHSEASDLQRERHELEERLANLRGGLDSAVANIVKLTLDFAREKSLDTIPSTLVPTPTLNTAETPEHRDLRLRFYYDRANDVKIIHERLAEHEQQQYQDINTRGLRVDRAELLSIAEDHDFDQLYLHERQVLQRELEIALEDANNLRDICVKAGLNPDEPAQVHDYSDLGSVNSRSEVDLTKVGLTGLAFPSDFPDSAYFLESGSVNNGISRTLEPLDFWSRAGRPLAPNHQTLNVESWVRNVEDVVPIEYFADAPWGVSLPSRSNSHARSEPTLHRVPSSGLKESSSPPVSTASDPLSKLSPQHGHTTDVPEKVHEAAAP
ncbi:hypothetical protein LTR95_009377 [Oleoguttula sp. CCFEE 5521]